MSEKKPIRLYELTAEAYLIETTLADNDGELTPELEQKLDTLLRNGKDKLEAAAQIVRNLEASAADCEEEALRLEKRANSYHNQAANLKRLMLAAVDGVFGGKLKTDMFTIYGQTSADTVQFDVSPDADLTVAAQHNPELVRQKYELNKIALKQQYDTNRSALPSWVMVTEKPGIRSLRIK